MDEGTSTTASRGGCVSMEKMVEIIRGFPEPPKIYAMDYKCFSVMESQILPNNSIFISTDLADKLEKCGVIKKPKRTQKGGG